MKKFQLLILGLLVGGALQAQLNNAHVAEVKVYVSPNGNGVIEARISGKGAGDMNFVSFSATSDILPGGGAVITAGGLYTGGGEGPIIGGKGKSNSQTKTLTGTFSHTGFTKGGRPPVFYIERTTPSSSQVESWVEHAKELDPMVTH